MNNGASEILTITADVITGGNYVNTAIVYGNETDNNMNNNVSTIETFPTDFFIPEGFSPNGDGINDLFVIRGIFNYPSNTFTIYNRWGSEVFQATPYQNNWSGKSTKGLKIGGDDLPMGTYFYILDLGEGSPIYKGTIYLSK
jgi:gliding motility-associated-like protein